MSRAVSKKFVNQYFATILKIKKLSWHILTNFQWMMDGNSIAYFVTKLHIISFVFYFSYKNGITDDKDVLSVCCTFQIKETSKGAIMVIFV